MDLAHLLVGVFGTIELADFSPDQLSAGVDLLRLERDGGRRFALWCPADMLGVAPDLNVAVEDGVDREIARDFMDTVGREVTAEERPQDRAERPVETAAHVALRRAEEQQHDRQRDR